MNDPMNDIDEKIREALHKEDSQLLEHFRNEPSIHEMVIETFRGRHRWLVVIVFLSLAVSMCLLALCGYKFFQANTTGEMITWATGFLWIIVWISMLKIWYWIELSKNAVTREVKRLELQIAKLSQRLEAPK